MVPIRPNLRRVACAVTVIAAGFACDLTRGEEPRFSAPELRSLQERFERRQGQMRTGSVEFTQTLSLAGMKNPAVSRGRILYAAPGRLRIEYEKPAGELVLLPGDGTLVTRKAGREPAVRPLDRTDERTRRSLLLLLALFEGKLPAPLAGTQLEARRAGEGKVVVTLAHDPAQPARSGEPERVDTTLTWPALDPVAVSIRLPGGAGMSYEFARMERNAALPPDTFAAPGKKP